MVCATCGDGAARRRRIVAGNWKMNLTTGPAAETARKLLSGLAGAQPGLAGSGDIILFPTFTALAAVRSALAGQDWVKLGAQNMHWLAQGAYTGEVSPAMLVDAGCCAVLIGHSERRTLFGEGDEAVARKAAAALAAGLLPVICVGETRAERETGATQGVLGRQVGAVAASLSPEDIARAVFAYEPVWAIGTGLAASAADAVAAAHAIREALPVAAATRARVLYGGSVKTDNVADFMGQPDIDGVLVGGASLDGAGFAALALAGLTAGCR